MKLFKQTENRLENYSQRGKIDVNKFSINYFWAIVYAYYKAYIYSISKTSQRNFLGILLFILSGFIFVVEDVFIKLLPENISLLQLIFFNNLFSLIPIFILNAAKKQPFNIINKNLPLHLLRSIFSLLTVFFFIGALRIIPLTQTLTLSFSAPLFMIILSSALLKQKVDLYIWFLIFIGFIGVFIILNPNFSSFKIECTMALFSGLTYALSLIILDKLNIKENNFSNYLKYTFISMFIISIFMPFFWEPLSIKLLIQFTIIGSLYGIGMYILAYSLRLTPVYLIAPFDYVALIWVILFDYILFNFQLSSRIVFGMVIIVMSGLYVSKNTIESTHF